MKFFSLVLVCLMSITLQAAPSVQEMSIEEKVGQLLMVHFQGEEANKEAEVLIREIKVGSFIYYNWSNGLHSPEQVQKLSHGLQQLAQQNPTPIPLIMAIDQEGGVVTRLQKGFSQFPSVRALGNLEDLSLLKQCAYVMGQEMQAVGIHLNLAPVVDVGTLASSAIGIRCLADTPKNVSSFASSLVEGYHQAGIMVCLKHFPGYGEVEADAHETLPILHKSLADLEKHELIPYRHLLKQADMIMAGHILVPPVDSNRCASLSSFFLQDLLRQQMGYEGVILSDSLVMEGLLKCCESIEEAAIRAVAAGCDMLILGGKQLLGPHLDLELKVEDVRKIFLALVEAIKEGRIPLERLDTSVERILKLKEQYGLFNWPSVTVDTIEERVNTKEHQRLVEQVARETTNVVKNTRGLPLHLKQQNVVMVAPSIVQTYFLPPLLEELCKDYCLIIYDTFNPTPEQLKKVKKWMEEDGSVLFFSYQAWKSKAQQTFIQKLLSEGGSPKIVICLGHPQDEELFPNADVLITTFSPTTPSIKAALQLLK